MNEIIITYTYLRYLIVLICENINTLQYDLNQFNIQNNDTECVSHNHMEVLII